MFQSEHLQEKWAPVLNCEGLDSIKDSYKKAVTAVLLENQEKFLREQQSFSQSGSFLTEAPTNDVGTGGFSGSSAAGTETTLSDITLVDSLSLTNGHIDSFTHRKLVAGSNVTITPASDGNITIASTDTNTVYTHPSYTTRSIDTDGVEVLDTFTSDAIGSVTAITKRTLPAATTSAAGVMSSTDKTKLDAMNVVQYAAALDTVATYGFIYFDED